MPAMSRPPRGLALHHVLYALVAIGLVIVLVMQLTGGDENEATQRPSPGAQPTAQADATLMDPAPYRTTIQQLEAVLYKDEPAGLSDATQASRLAVQLGTALLRAPNRLQGQRAGRDVMAFGNRIGQEADVGYATADLRRAREDWERVRGKLFQPAAWFRTAPTASP